MFMGIYTLISILSAGNNLSGKKYRGECLPTAVIPHVTHFKSKNYDLSIILGKFH